MKNLKTMTKLSWLFILAMIFYGCGEDEEIVIGTIPIADAGPNLSSNVGALVTLDGSDSFDADGDPLTYEWELVTVPATSSAALTGSDQAIATFRPDVAGNYTARLLVNDGNNSDVADEAIITVDEAVAETVIVDSDITSDETWIDIFTDPTIADYRVTKTTVNVTASLTIDPGVVVEFVQNSGLSVEGNGTLAANGTAGSGIIFTGVQKTPGFWKGINIQTNSTSNLLSYLTIEFAGQSGFDGANLLANLTFDDNARVVVNNSNFINGAGSGIYIRTNEVELPNFESNDFKDNLFPVTTVTRGYKFLDPNSDYSGNTNDFINTVYSGALSENALWRSLNVPYRLPTRTENISGDIEVAAGANFLCTPSSGLYITTNGSFNAIGTSGNLITFSGEQDTRGYWKGIAFQSNNTSNELTFVSVSNGGEDGFDGANLKANVMVEDGGRLKITNSTLTKSGNAGLYVRDDESILDAFGNNLITDNVVPVIALMDHYGFFDEASDFTGNDDDYIDSKRTGRITADAIWKKLTVPYRLSDGQEEVDGDIVIRPGAEFLGQPGSGIEVRTTGSLNAVGISDDKIIFRGEQNVNAYWAGLRFLSNNANNVLEQFEVKNGGQTGFDGANRKANIEVGNGAICSIINGSISQSGGYGIRIQSGGSYSLSTTTFSNNQLSGNSNSGGVQNDNL